MKKQAYTMIALAVLVGSMAVAAQAQGISHARLVGNIPFDFNVADMTMPAGEYILEQVNPASNRAVLQLRSRDGKSSVLIMMNGVSGTASERTRLVFNCYGNRRYFAQAWTSSDASGLQASKSKAERATQEEMASLKAQTETIALRSR